MYVHNDPTCIIFLHDRFFKKKSFFSSSKYKKLIKELENKGIAVASITDIINYQNTNNVNNINNSNKQNNNVTFNNVPEYDNNNNNNNNKDLSLVTNSLLIETPSMIKGSENDENENEQIKQIDQIDHNNVSRQVSGIRPILKNDKERDKERERERLRIPEKTSLINFRRKYTTTHHTPSYTPSYTPKQITLSFDDKLFPEINCLYFHLFNGQYYNDSIYIKRKVEKEREMLLLLAGKLGVEHLSYHSTITETTLSHIDAEINVKGIENKIQYTKNKIDHVTVSSEEVYQNRGAPVYLNSKSREQLNYNIEQSLGSMKSNIFSYDYYKTNAKLEAFVYKRFVFKMESMDYMIDVEDISEKSFIVKTCFMNYGLGVRVDKNISYSESIKYHFSFYTDKELRMELMKIARQDNDNFLVIREIYDADKDNRDQSVHYISDYVKNEALKLNYITNLQNYILDVGFDAYYTLCHNFNSSSQIRDWLYTMDREYNERMIREKEKYKKDEKENICEKETNKQETNCDRSDNTKFINNNIPKEINIEDRVSKYKDLTTNLNRFISRSLDNLIDGYGYGNGNEYGNGYRILEMTSPEEENEIYKECYSNCDKKYKPVYVENDENNKTRLDMYKFISSIKPPPVPSNVQNIDRKLASDSFLDTIKDNIGTKNILNLDLAGSTI
uniref:Uncharacterized protein n=1 Tax=viral metagenome TaxID=1070528 RepID=A0A6C0F3P1_9ZZZZ